MLWNFTKWLHNCVWCICYFEPLQKLFYVGYVSYYPHSLGIYLSTSSHRWQLLNILLWIPFLPFPPRYMQKLFQNGKLLSYHAGKLMTEFQKPVIKFIFNWIPVGQLCFQYEIKIWHIPSSLIMCSYHSFKYSMIISPLLSPLPTKSKGTLGLHSVCLSVCPSVILANQFSRLFFFMLERYWFDIWCIVLS